MSRPQLLIISRKRSRAFTNVGEISKEGKRLSYQVGFAEPVWDVTGFTRMIKSCEAMMGV